MTNGDLVKGVRVWVVIGLIGAVVSGLLYAGDSYFGAVAAAHASEAIQPVEAKVDEAVAKAVATAASLDTLEAVQAVQFKAIDDKMEIILWLLDPNERKRSRRGR